MKNLSLFLVFATILCMSHAQQTYTVQFDVSVGSDGAEKSILVEINPEWSPIGAARFKELLDSNFFAGLRFFRVVPDFVAQFGISGSPTISSKWRSQVIRDDPMGVTHNTAGTLTFATSGPNSRTTQMFFNLADNYFLDNQGFTPFGKVVSGLDAMQSINAEYGEQPSQGRIQSEGNRYLEEYFPNLSYIIGAEIVNNGGDGASQNFVQQESTTTQMGF